MAHKVGFKRASVLARSCAAILLSSGLTLGSGAAAIDFSRPIHFNIPPQSLSSALVRFADQARIQFTAPASLLNDLQSAGAIGTFPAEAALELLLRDTGLTYRVIDDGTIAISTGNASTGDDKAPRREAASTTQASEQASISRYSLAGVGVTTPVAAHQAVPTQSEQPQSANETTGNRALEEVLVTAERRSADVQDVPIAINVLDGDVLRERGMTDLQSLGSAAPDLNYAQSSIFTQFTIRGVGSRDNNELGDAAVTVGIDGEYITRSVAMNATMFDLERLEVLRGPQGTLYGRNATAGAINIITNKPSRTLEGSVSLGAGNYSALLGQGFFNVPLTDALAVRFAGMHSQHDGYRDAGPAGEVDDQNVSGFRSSMLWEPTTAFSWYLAGEYSHVDQASPSRFGYPIDPAVRPDLVGAEPRDLDIRVPDEWPLPRAGYLNVNQRAVRTKMDLDLGFGSVSYVGSYRDVSVRNELSNNGYIPDRFAFQNKYDVQNQSHELRLFDETERAFWQTGVYYGREDQRVARGTFLPEPLPVPPFNRADPYDYLNFFLRDTESVTRAIFGQASYDIADELTFTAGARYTKDRKSRIAVDAIPFVFAHPNPPTSFDQPGVAPLVGVPTSGDSSKTTWLAGLDWTYAPDKMVYAKVSTGYKAGGFDSVGPYEPESLTAYEIGTKNRFDNGRYQLNLASFYYDYTDQQTVVFIDTVVGNRTLNAGKSEIFGIEVSAEWQVMDADRISLTVNYLDAEYKNLPTNANRVGAGAIPVSLAGNRPPQAPEWTVALGYEHLWALKPGDLRVNINSQYKSKYYLQVFNWETDAQDAFTQTDASLTFRTAEGSWELVGYVRNIEDERVLTDAAFTGGVVNIFNFSAGPPRTFGVQVTRNF